MNPKKSDMFAPGARDSIDSECLDCDPSPGPQSAGLSSNPEAWPTSSRMTQGACSSAHSEPQPCVSRSPATEDCATQQFLLWAAIRRNRSVKMAPYLRLQCPLILCGERFEEHEAMLRHLSKCQHLKTGEYLCFECMRVERFNQGSRGCCKSHPSKRRKIVKLAKNFFSNIGSKVRRSEAYTSHPEDVTMPPPAYDEMLPAIETSPENELPQPQPQPQPQLELNGTEIIELDSGSIHQLDPINYDECEQYQMRHVPRSSSSNVISATRVPIHADEHLSQIATPAQAMPRRSTGGSLIAHSPAASQRPSLALDTEVDQYRKVSNNKYLTPSSSVRSQQSSLTSAHGVSPITPWSSSSQASGMSADSWGMASGINTHMTSPISPISPVGAYANPAMSMDMVKPKDWGSCAKDPFGDCSEKSKSQRPADYSQPGPMYPDVPDHILFPPAQEKDNYSWLSSVNTELSLATSVNVMFSSDTADYSNLYTNYAETTQATDAGKLLVESVWDALRQHVNSSFSKLNGMANNPLVVRLRVESPISIATKGFESLRNILDGKDLSDPLDYLCFIHVVYAFSLVLHEEDLIESSGLLFKQALAYRGFLDPRWFDAYSQVVSRIWDPEGHASYQIGTVLETSQTASGTSSSTPYRLNPASSLETDAFATVSQNFLDGFESLVLNGKSMKPADIVSSELWSTHAAEIRTGQSNSVPFVASAAYIIDVLGRQFGDNSGVPVRLRAVIQRIQAHVTTTVRQLELELMQAGKNALTRPQLFDRYARQVRGLCNSLYLQHSINPRVKYHLLAASFAEQILHSFAREEIVAAQPEASEPPAPSMGLSGSFDDLFHFSSLAGPFDVTEGMGNPFPSLHGPEPASQYTIPTSNADLASVPMSSQLSVTDLQSNHNSAFTTDIPQPNIPSPGLVAGSQSPSVIPPNNPSAGQVFSSPYRKPQNTRAKPQQTKKATKATTGANTASTSKLDTGTATNPATTEVTTPKVEANSCCEICGYRPKGDPQWFKGSMAKHKKLQHSTDPPTIYRCPFPGCTSAYKNRQDNLRQHQIEKNHFVDDDGPQKRPLKRKRVA